LRVEAFNRVVAYVKANAEKLSQDERETQLSSASHPISETQKRCASQDNVETHWKLASQCQAENRNICASHSLSENQKNVASHVEDENQNGSASQSSCENHTTIASRKGEYANLARQLCKGKIKPPSEIADLVWYHNMLYDTEKQLAKRLDRWSKTHPLRIRWLSKIQGIGPILASGLIAWLSPIERFPNISKSFEKQKAEKSRYRRIYDEKKQYYLRREDLRKPIENKEKGAKLHVRLMAMRYTVKRFLADLWLVWRRMEGLPITKPYATAVLGHDGFETPETDKP